MAIRAVKMSDLRDEGTPPEIENKSRLIRTGAEFVLDQETTLVPLWGTEDQVLWARGEPLLFVAPTGVGKTTVAIQLVAARLGLASHFLGLPVQDDGNRILYMAMDRPPQIARAMARVFDESHRDIIHERLVIWRGPPPSDLGKNDEMLLQLCSETGCQEVYIDSLKDATLKLSDEESTGGLNRAIQRCTVAGIQVVGLHHQRKRQSGGEKPKTLDDVYGNMQLTAGVGSVVLLWGAAGDSIVELVHLKQPAGEVGPWMLEHDHHIGRTTVFQGFDAFAFLKGRGKVGATATEAARAMVEKDAVTDNQRKKAQRLLEGLVRKGYADKTEPVIGGSGGSEGARYRYLDGGLISSSRAPDRAPDSGVQAQSTTAPPPSPDTDHEIPAQSNGHVIGHTVQTGAPDTTPLFKQGVGGSRPVPDYDLEEPF